MKKRKILSIFFAVTAVLIATGFAVQNHFHAKQYKQLLENSYTHAYAELVTAVSELNVALQKTQYASSPSMLSMLCTDVYGKSVAAQMALGELPASSVILEQTCSFLVQTGDYAFYLSRTAQDAPLLLQDIHSTLQKLSAVSNQLSDTLTDLYSDLSGGSITVAEMIGVELNLAQSTHDGAAAEGGTSFQSLESDFPEVPTLIYDGPFSEHLSSRTPKAIAHLSQCSRDEARSAAAEFLALRPEILTYIGDGGGILPTWCFSASYDGGELYIEITKQGCKVLSLFTSRTTGISTLSIEEGLSIARDFLSYRGYENMKETYHINQGNVLTVNFAYSDNDVLCYPDLIKVTVALDTGAVVGFEAHGWIMNHSQRALPAVAISSEEAASLVSPDLNIVSQQLALIPSGGEYEVLCHEFKCCTDQGENVIIYINAATGNEEKILLLLENENGTLVW